MYGGDQKSVRGLQRRIKAKKESDKERSELRQSRGSRIRDERIKGGGRRGIKRNSGTGLVQGITVACKDARGNSRAAKLFANL